MKLVECNSVFDIFISFSRTTVKPSTSSEWLNVEKSVRFTLPPDEVKRRSNGSSSKNAHPKATKSQVTFIPPLCPDEIQVVNDHDWSHNHQWPSAFENKRCCWSSQSCRQQPRFSRPLPPPPPPVSSGCCCCYKSEAFHSPRFHNHELFEEVIPDYTDDEEEAFKQSFYPSGSMTLPMKSSQDKSKHVAKPSTQLPPQPSVLKKATSSDLILLDQNKAGSENPVSEAAGKVKKSLNESGESDPGYESDSTGSKSKLGSTSPEHNQEGPKATTLPRRSAAVQKISLDRRKLATEEQKQHGLTVEIISPVRVKPYLSMWAH